MTRSTSFIVLSLTVALLLASACGFTYGGETLPWGVVVQVVWFLSCVLNF